MYDGASLIKTGMDRLREVCWSMLLRREAQKPPDVLFDI